MARMAHKTKIISTIILNPKFFPVMKGKSVDLETKKARNGRTKIPKRIAFLRDEFMPETIPPKTCCALAK